MINYFYCNLGIDRFKLHSVFITICFMMTYFFGSFIFLIFALFTCLSNIEKNLTVIILTMFFLPILILVNAESAKIYFLFFMTVILLSSKFSDQPFKFLNIYSKIMFPFLCTLPFLPQLYGETDTLLSLTSRLWPILPSGVILNPNPLGFFIACISISFLINKNFIFLSICILLLLMTQSRAAILFFLFFAFFYKKSISTKILISVIFTIIFILISTSNLIDRFVSDGNNGRFQRIEYYNYYIDLVFPLGANKNLTAYLLDNFSTVDNMYIYLLFTYGIIGIILISLLVFLLIKNKKDHFFRIRIVIFLGIMLYGLAEIGFLAVYPMWPIFAMCFNNMVLARERI